MPIAIFFKEERSLKQTKKQNMVVISHFPGEHLMHSDKPVTGSPSKQHRSSRWSHSDNSAHGPRCRSETERSWTFPRATCSVTPKRYKGIISSGAHGEKQQSLPSLEKSTHTGLTWWESWSPKPGLPEGFLKDFRTLFKFHFMCWLYNLNIENKIRFDYIVVVMTEEEKFWLLWKKMEMRKRTQAALDIAVSSASIILTARYLFRWQNWRRIPRMFQTIQTFLILYRIQFKKKKKNPLPCHPQSPFSNPALP